MTKYLAIAILITGFLVGDAYGESRIADVYFDDGSVLHNAEYSWLENHGDRIRVKYENEIFALPFSDIKTIEFVVEPERNGPVTIKIKTKTGVVVNDQFLLNIKNSNLRGGGYCARRVFSFVNKLTGEKVLKLYPITNLTQKFNMGRNAYCSFEESETKAISSIVFKD